MRNVALALLLVTGLAALAAATAGSAPSSTINATEEVPFDGVVVTVPGSCAGTHPPTITINWGDGSATSTGSQAASGGNTAISGSHTYALAGTYTGTVTFSPSCGNTVTADFTADVADQPLTGTAVSPPIAVLAGQPYGGTVATFNDANPDGTVSQYNANIDWGDGSPSSAGTITARSGGGFAVAGTHTYASAGGFPVTVTINDDGGAKTVVSETATVDPVPTGVAFTISPDTDPVLSRQTLTFAITDPSPDVTYQWDFGDTDAPRGSASAPFVVDATGTTVTHAYPDPPAPPSNPTIQCATAPGCGASSAVYVVRVQALIPAHATLMATPKNVVVVPVQPPTASFQVLQSSANNGGTGASTSVTHPVTIVPQASLPEVQGGAQDEIVRQDFYFNLKPGEAPTGTPDLTCLPDGTCGHYAGTALEPGPSQLTPEPGEQNLGTAPVVTVPGGSCRPTSPRDRVQPALCAPRAGTSVAPTGGFEAFSINFWNAALADMGPSADDQRLLTLPPLESPSLGPSSYPPLASVNLADVNGNDGEQGIPWGSAESFNGPGPAPFGPYRSGQCSASDPYACRATGGCFEGYPMLYYNFLHNNDGAVGSEWGDDPYGGLSCNDTGPPTNRGEFGPSPDLARYGAGSVQQLEDQSNFLYNYATVVGPDTDLNSQFGPATGATQGRDHAIVPRTVTMVAYDSEGVASAPQTENVTLTPATPPTLQLCIVDVSIPGAQCRPTKSKAPFVVSDTNELRLETTGSAGGTDPLMYYTVQVGQPNAITPPATPPGYTGPSIKEGYCPDGVAGKHQPSNTICGNCSPEAAPAAGFLWNLNSSYSRHPTPWPVPAFSDLEAGAFPWHDCALYEERTVDSSATPEPVPASGPNVPARTAAVRPQTVEHPLRASPDGYTEPASGIAEPVLITTNPNGLNVEFGTKTNSAFGAGPGVYSISVAAYDSSGLGAVTRIDGITAQPAQKGALCQTVNSQPFSIADPHMGAKSHPYLQKLAFSGGCVTQLTQSGNPVLFASTTEIDIDGVPLVPDPGDEIVIKDNNASSGISEVYVVKAGPDGCSITPKVLASEAIPSRCKPPSSRRAGTIYVAPGPGGYSSPPGIAEVAHFDAGMADSMLGARVLGGLPQLIGPPAAKNGNPKAVKGCGLYGPDAQQWRIPKGAEYDNGFAVVTKPCVSFTADKVQSLNGESRIAFWDSLPQGFGKSGGPPPSQVVLQGSDQPAITFLSAHPYGEVARARRSERVIDGSPASFPQAVPPSRRARVADLGNLPGFPNMPSCPNPPHNSKSGLTIPDSTDMGPLSLPEGASFCYDSKTGDFIGNVKMTIPGPLPINGVKVGFEIGHGRLIDAGGEISGNIPIGPIIVNDLKFDIQTEPVEVAGAIEASIVDILDVEAGVIFKPSTPEVDFEGSVGIAGFQFGNFAIDFDKDTVGMHVTIAKDFGPASVNVTVKGAVIFSPFAFYLEGQGHACLFICLGIEGLISNEGLAACGSIDLVLVNFSGGFAVIWSGPNSGVHLFLGCNLQPYIPAALQNVKGTAPDPAGHAAAAQPLSPGQSKQLVLYHKDDCTIRITTHCTPTVAAVQVHSLVSGEATGATPLVTLTGPGGATGDTRVVQTPSTPGYYGFEADAGLSGGSAGGQTDEGMAFAEQDPVPIYDTDTKSSAYCATSSKDTALGSGGVNTGRLSAASAGCPRVTTTTLFVADPSQGPWTLSVAGDSPAVVDVQTADSEPPLKVSEFNATVHKATVKGGTRCTVEPKLHLKVCKSGFTVRFDGHQYSSDLIKTHRLLLAPSVELPPTTAKSLVQLGHPSVLDLDVPPIDDSRLRAILLKAPHGFVGTIAVLDHGPTVDQVIAESINAKDVPAKGLPILFEPTPDFGGKHEVEAFLSTGDGAPDQTLVLSKFTSPPLPKAGKPKIRKIVREGSTVDVYFNPGDDPVSNGINVGLAAGGLHLQDTFTGAALHPIDAPEGIGAARQSGEYMVSIPDVDPTEPISVAIGGSDQGQPGATAVRSVGALIRSIPESRLLVSAHIRG